MWIDSHCHLDAAEFDADRAAVIRRAREAGVTALLLPAVEAGNFAAVRQLAGTLASELGAGNAYALGIHPLYVAQAAAGDLDALAAELQQRHDDPLLVAVGEIGLDHFVPGLDPALQQRFYVAQLKLAREHGLPVILHLRRSADALLAGLRRVPVPGGIVHAFNGSIEQARQFIGLGFVLGFGGAVTFERALQIRRLAAELPEAALVLETDAPDIPPQWLYRDAAARAAGAAQGRNEPGELPRIAATLATLRGSSLAELAAMNRSNLCRALPRLGRLLDDAT